MTEHFSFEELRCKCGCDVSDEIKKNLHHLAINLEKVRAYFGNRPIKVHSGYRCKYYNVKIRGARQSHHMNGEAADISIEGVTPKELKAGLNEMIDQGGIEQGGIGLYSKFVHYDYRGHKQRW